MRSGSGSDHAGARWRGANDNRLPVGKHRHRVGTPANTLIGCWLLLSIAIALQIRNVQPYPIPFWRVPHDLFTIYRRHIARMDTSHGRLTRSDNSAAGLRRPKWPVARRGK